MNLERLANKRILLLFSLFLCFAACGSPKVGSIKRIEGIRHEYNRHGVWVPLWIRFPQSLSQNEIAAVGVYGPTRYPERGREKAIENGRYELSRSFSVHIENLVKTWAIDSESYFTDTASSQRFTEEISRQITDVELVGAVVKVFWVHPIEKMNYALVSVSLDQARQQAISTVRQIGETQKRLFVRERVDEAFKELDRVLQQLSSEDFQNQ